MEQGKEIRFSNSYVPVQVWMIDVVQDFLDLNNKLLNIIPRSILKKTLEQFKVGETSRETIVYVIAHDLSTGSYDGLAGYLHHGADTQKDLRVVMKNSPLNAVEFSFRLNQLRLQHDPELQGTKSKPDSFDAKTLDEMLTKLKGTNRLEVFETMFKVDTSVAVASTSVPVKFGVPSTVRLKRVIEQGSVVGSNKLPMTKDGKIPTRTRKALVAKFGEKNIAELEQRVATKIKNNETQ